MKRVCLLILLLTCVLAIPAAQAEIELPEAMAAVFAADSWAGYTPVAADYHTLEGVEAPYSAVIMQRDGRNILCILETQPDGSLLLNAMSSPAIYQGDLLPTMEFYWDEEGGELHLMTYTYAQGRDGDLEVYQINDANKVWYINMAELYGDQSYGIKHRTTITVYEYLAYQEANLRGTEEVTWEGPTRRVFALLHRKLPQFNIETYARTYDDAVMTLGGLPKLEPGEQQDPMPVPGEAVAVSAESVPVYSGPMERYLRGEGAEAFAGEKVFPIGLEGNYAFVAYGAAGDAMRYGYVAENALAQRPEVADLSFAWLNAELTEGASLLDGPDGNALTLLPPGTSVSYLATLGSDLAYVEAPGVTPARGFVPSEALAISYGMFTGSGADVNAYLLENVELIDDPYRRVTPTVLGLLEQGAEVVFLDNLYGEWAYIEATVGGELVQGFVPRWAVESTTGDGLEGNG